MGLDPVFGRYLVYDEAGDYACIDDEERVRYHRNGTVDPDPASTRQRFTNLLDRLLPLLPETDTGQAQEVSSAGARLVRNPLRGYERGNLDFVRGEIGEFELAGGADVIRCMNVFMYFDRDFRRRALDWMAGLLRPGGLVLCGSNWAHSASSRYTVYQKTGQSLTAREFATSIENVRPLESSPWYGLHDDDLELLRNADTVAALRSDEPFRARFDQHLDTLLAQRGFCARDPDGYLGAPPESMPNDERAGQSAELADQLDRDGYVDEAVAALRRAGRPAWRNAGDHVAIPPVEPPPLAVSEVL